MIKKIQDANRKNRTVVLRLDLNIPYSNAKSNDLSRIEKVKETILFLVKHSNKVVILSHFGRPNGKIDKDLSLENLLGYLKEMSFNSMLSRIMLSLKVCWPVGVFLSLKSS